MAIIFFNEKITVKEGECISLPTPSRENHDFLGWFLDDVLFDEKTAITSNITLIAKWEQNNLYKITYVNALDENTTLTYIKGETPAIPQTPSYEGYVFVGWFIDAEFSERYFFDYAFYEDVTLYAKYYDTSLEEYIVIYNFDQFNAIKNKPTAKYIFACDIDCGGAELSYIPALSGEIDGNGYKIHNFVINESGYYAGIVKENHGVIKNLYIDNFAVNITSSTAGDTFYAVLCALNYGLISNCHILNGEFSLTTTNTARMALIAGSVVGMNGYGDNYNGPDYVGITENCTNKAKITANLSHTGDSEVYYDIGGVVGRNTRNSTISNCKNYGEVITHTKVGCKYNKCITVGGICGWNFYGDIYTSSNHASVSSTLELLGTAGQTYTYTGGGIGLNYAVISDCYSTGKVTKGEIDEYNYRYESIDYIGGFVGCNLGTITNCFTTGNSVASPSLTLYIGGFVGGNEQAGGMASTITNCFSTGNCEIIDDVEDSLSSVYSGYFAGNNAVTIESAYYLESAKITYQILDNDKVEYELTNQIGEAVSENKFVSEDFLKNTLLFNEEIWVITEKNLPIIK